MLCPKSAIQAILGLGFLDPKDLCLPNQFLRGSWQKRSVSTHLTWCQRRNWVASMIELTLILNPSCVCHDMNIFWPASFVTFPWRYWIEFIQSWKDLRKHYKAMKTFDHWQIWVVLTLVFIQIQETGYFECLWCENATI